MATGRAVAIRDRFEARQGGGIVAGSQSYRATDQSRNRVRVRGGSGDRHADDRAREELRHLSQDMERNADPYAVILHGMARLIGEPTPRPTVGNRAWRAEVARRWRAHARRKRGGFDRRGMQTWGGLCRSWWLALFRDGDVATVPQDDGTIATFEAEQIAGGRKTGNQHRRTVGGITLDGNDRAIEYWIAPRVNGVVKPKEAEPIEAQHVNFMVAPWSVSQTRGVPLLTAGLDNTERVDALVESEIITAEQASNIYGVMTRDLPEGAAPPSQPLASSSTAPMGAYTAGTDNPEFIDFPAGSYFDLPAGMGWNSISPTRPNLNVVELLRQIISQACAETGIPFAVLFSDFKGVNWSGNRGLVSLTRDALTWWRQLVCEPFVDPYFAWWLEREINERQLPVPVDDQGASIRDPARCYAHVWDWPQRPEWPDPYKEEQTHQLGIENRTASRHRILGPDWQEITDELHLEDLRADELYIQRIVAAASAILDAVHDAGDPALAEIIAETLTPLAVVNRGEGTQPAAPAVDTPPDDSGTPGAGPAGDPTAAKQIDGGGPDSPPDPDEVPA